MKEKKKKLTLRKQTLANLEHRQLQEVIGGSNFVGCGSDRATCLTECDQQGCTGGGNNGGSGGCNGGGNATRWASCPNCPTDPASGIHPC